MSRVIRPKSYKKDEFLGLVSKKSGLSKVDSGRALDAVLKSLLSILANGDSINFIGYGSFSILKRDAREGRNPKTGERIQIKESRGIKFTPGKKLKDAINS